MLGLTRIYGGQKTKGMEAKIQYHKKILNYSVFQYDYTELFITPKKTTPSKGIALSHFCKRKLSESADDSKIFYVSVERQYTRAGVELKSHAGHFFESWMKKILELENTQTAKKSR